MVEEGNIIILTLNFRWISDSVALAVAVITCFSLFNSVTSPRSSIICLFSSFIFWHNAAFSSLVWFRFAAKTLFLCFNAVLSNVLLLLDDDKDVLEPEIWQDQMRAKGWKILTFIFYLYIVGLFWSSGWIAYALCFSFYRP